MSEERNDGGPAYPHPVAIGPGGDVYSPHDVMAPGMSLRDWFAGQAIAGLLADGANLRRLAETNRDVSATTARSAYAIADQLLLHRRQP